MAKEVTFPANPRPRAMEGDLDAFVQGTRPHSPEPMPPPIPAPAVRQRMKRLTFDIPADLHTRMKLACVREGRDMAEVLRELIAQRFP